VNKDFAAFYKTLGTLTRPGIIPLKSLNGQSALPKQGVYFFFTAKEFRVAEPRQLRLSRVGTHAVTKGAKTTLWNRLKAHQGSVDGGKHRESAFRLHVGNALAVKNGVAKDYPHWNQAGASTEAIRSQEQGLEQQVSVEIGDMGLVWLRVEDAAGPASARAYIEEQVLALLALEPGADPPSAQWLGRHSPHPKIRQSGLWNADHVAKPYDPAFLPLFQQYAQWTLGKGPQPAPLGEYLEEWYRARI
jgi:hypothetical protein